MKPIKLLFFLLLVSSLSYGQNPWINEIHYDNTGTDANEGIEIAIPSGYSCAGLLEIILYNGASGATYSTTTVDQSTSNTTNGVEFAWTAISGIQNGAPDGVALVCNGALIQFLSYEGSFIATNGPANGMTSTDIGVSEGTTATTESLQLIGTGTQYSDFTWSANVSSTNDAINTGQTISVSTTLEFVTTTSTSTEGGISVSVCVAIANEDATNATTVEIDLDGLSTATNGTDYDDSVPAAITFPQTLTFPAGSSANQCLTIYFSNDDAIYELSESVILNLQNPAGGSSAVLGTNTQHTLSITDNDSNPCMSIFSDDFSSGLTQWNNTADWTTVAGELKHNLSSTAGVSTINSNIGLQNFNSGDYEWSLCMRNGSWDPSGGNNFSFVLISDTDDTSNDITGYRLGINHVSGETDDLLKLYRVNNGVDTAILTTSFNWDANDDVCIRVTRSNTGDWELFYDPNGSGEVSGGTVIDTVYSTGSFISFFFEYTSTRAGLFWVDDVNICKAPISCPTTSTWDGTSWSPSVPDANTNAVLNANYNTSIAGQPEFTACSLTIDSNVILTVASTNFVEVIGDVVNNGRILIQDKGSFVQVDDAATYDDTGSAFFATDNTSQVTKTTAPINNWFEYTYWSSPVANETVEDALFTANPDRRFYFNAANFEDSTYEVGNNNTATAYLAGDTLDDIDDDGNDWQYASGLMTPGVGYAATLSTTSFSFGTPGDNFAHIFEGTLNNGNINIPVVRNDGSNSSSAVPDNNWNFIGNPYPSAIDVDLFFLTNQWSITNTTATLDGSIYLWSQNTAPSDTNNGNQNVNFSGADYAVINGIGETAGGDGIVPTRHISSAQGFFVKFVDTAIRPSSTGTVSFSNSMRIKDNNTQFLRINDENTESSIEKVRLNLTSDNGVFSQALVGYTTSTTNDFDGAYYDAVKNLSSNNSVKFGSIINNNPNIYVIQGRSLSSLNLNEIVPLAFSTSINVATIYTISLASIEGDFMTNNTIYLKDNLLSTIHDLSASDYSFTSEVGQFNDRFEIVFNNASLSNNDFVLNENNLSIIELENNEVLFKTGSDLTIKSVQIFDVLGRNLYTFKGTNSTETFNLSNLSQAAYVAKVELSNGQLISKKAIKK